MRFSIAGLLVLLVVPVAVSACEGDCIVGITNAFVTNYTSPVKHVMENVVSVPNFYLARLPTTSTGETNLEHAPGTSRSNHHDELSQPHHKSLSK